MCQRICEKCSKEKDLDDFENIKDNRYGITKFYKSRTCRKCRGRQRKVRCALNIEEFNRKARERYRKNHPKKPKPTLEEKIKKQKEYARQWRQDNKDKTRKYSETYKKSLAGKEKYKEYYQKNKDEICLQSKEYRQNNKEKVNANKLKYNKERRKNDPAFRIKRQLSANIYIILRRQGIKKSAKTQELIGCTRQEFKQHLENQFKEEMSWDNYGTSTKHWRWWEIEHIIPCAAFNLLDPEEQKKCFHYTNMRPAWRDENIDKSDFLEDGTRGRELRKIKRAKMNE